MRLNCIIKIDKSTQFFFPVFAINKLHFRYRNKHIQSNTDNGTKYKGALHHPFGVTCFNNGINQKFTKPARPQTNGKAERMIRTLMMMWHDKIAFVDSEHRKKELCRFINFYNTVKPHSGLNGDTPFEVLETYFSQPIV